MLIFYIYKKGELDISEDFSFANLAKNAFNSFFIYIWNMGYILGCSMVVTSHANVIYSSGGLFLFIFALAMGRYIHKFEYIGYALFLIGMYAMLNDTSASKTGENGQFYLGDFCAFLGAGSSAIYNFLNKRQSGNINAMQSIDSTSYKMHLFVTLTQNFIFATIFQLITLPFFVGPSIYFSMDPHMGAFGWLTNPDASFMVILIVAPVTGILGNLCFYTAHRYFSMEIIAFVMLSEPFLAQFVAVALGQDNLPGIKTFLGCTIVTIGVLLASIGQFRKEIPQDNTNKFYQEEFDEEYAESDYERLE